MPKWRNWLYALRSGRSGVYPHGGSTPPFGTTQINISPFRLRQEAGPFLWQGPPMPDGQLPD